MVIVVYTTMLADDFTPGRRAYEKRRACLVEDWRGRIEGDASGHILKKLLHVCRITCGVKEGFEGGARDSECCVVDRGLQACPKVAEQADKNGCIVTAAVDDSVAAAVGDIVSS